MGRPAPQELRDALRGPQNPALALPCPHCAAAPGKPCRLRHTRRTIPTPHPSRTEAAASTPNGANDTTQEQQR
jgi:hypothetical protein